MTTTEHPMSSSPESEPRPAHPADRRDPATPGELPPVLFILHDLADRIEQVLDGHPYLPAGVDVAQVPTISAVDAHTLRQVARALEGSVAGRRGIERRQVG